MVPESGRINKTAF